MGDFVYHGDHSITIDPDKSNFNTWTTWHMAPKSRPFVVAPSVKEQYVDVPASDGSLDYTEVLAGAARYANRIGQWEFIIDNGKDYVKWHELYTDILTKLHGKRFKKIILDDDPEYYWTGRLSVNGQFGNKDYSSIIISYNLEPYKYPIDSVGVHWWRWKSLFSNTITYGPFTVNGWKARNIINETEAASTINISCSGTMKLFPYDGSEKEQYSMFKDYIDTNPRTKYPYVTLRPGNNEYELSLGNNYMIFVGYGNVTIESERGKKL